MIKIVGPKDKRLPNVINTTSHSPQDWSRELSPFYLGPVYLYDGHIAENVENGWQYCKVYKKHVDVDSNPTNEYWSWANEGWSNTKAIRYPMGKGAVPEYSLWDNDKFGYIEARKKIYAPLYSKAVAKTNAFKKLRNMYKEGTDIILWDFDGYDHYILNMSLNDVINEPKKPMGHAFVLAMMLEWDMDYIKIPV